MKPYHPTPLDTSTTDLAEDLLLLTEQLAENAHDNWAILRMKEGWKWGKQRNDEAKTHPDLVPYEQLAESEKEYDRKTAMETVKGIISLGYMIEKK